MKDLIQEARDKGALILWQERCDMKMKLEALAEIYLKVDEFFENFDLYDASHIEGEDAAYHAEVMKRFKGLISDFLPSSPVEDK